MRLIFCRKLNKEAPGLLRPPFKGELGEKIYEHISKEAWQLWLAHQTMLINEYRLSLISKEAKAFLTKEMEQFLFGEGSHKPEGFKPVE